MDVQMPDMDGLEATRRIVADGALQSAIVVVTTFDRDDYLFQALEAGASGFLLKNAGPEQLVEAVRVAAAGDALLAPAVTRRVIERFAASPRAPARRSRRPELRPTGPPRQRRRPSWPCSPSASVTCCACSPTRAATPRSPPSCTSARRR
jgi:DNA-binding NarL/FixJ family response regulator